jgi:membrane-associated phospholipid phosphatase
MLFLINLKYDFLKNIAKLVSTIGNPIVLGLFFAFYNYFIVKSTDSQPWMILVVVAFLLIPLVVFVGLKVKKGEYADYDVSNRVKRMEVYKFILVLLFVLIVASFAFHFPISAKCINIAIFAQLLFSFILNQRLKVSMHTSFSFLYAFLFFPLNMTSALVLYVFGFFNGASRLLLNRHQPNEVIAGFILGNIVGVFYLLSIHYIK